MTTETLEQRVGHLEAANVHVATKSDLADLRAEMAELRAELKTEMAQLRAEMANLESRLVRWFVGATLGGMATASTLTLALTRLLG